MRSAIAPPPEGVSTEISCSQRTCRITAVWKREVDHDRVQVHQDSQLRGGPATSTTASSVRLLSQGRYWLFDPLGKVRVDVVSQRDPWLVHEKLDVIVKSGVLKDRAMVLDLKDYQRRWSGSTAGSAMSCRRACTPTGPACAMWRSSWLMRGRSASSTRICRSSPARRCRSACWS